MRPAASVAARFATAILALLGAADPGAADRSSPPPVEAAGAWRPPAAEDRLLANGLRLVVIPRGTVPASHLVWSVGAGSADDPPGLPGTAALLAEALVRGADGTSLKDSLRARGVLLDVEVEQDAIRYSIRAPSDRLLWAVRRLRRALMRPPREIEEARSAALDEAALRSGSSGRLLQSAAWRAAWGEADPYGGPVLGARAALGAIGPGDLAEFHARHVRPERMIVVAAGDVGTEALSRELERVGSARAIGPPPAPRRAPAVLAERVGPRIVLVDRPGPGGATIGLAVALPGCEALDPAALVASHLLGGPGYSRLLGALRDDLGVAYDARSWIEFRGRGALLVAQSAVPAEDAARALGRLVAEVEALRREPEAEELARARNSLASALLAGWYETNRSAARAWARLASLGLDREAAEDRLRRISAVRGDETARFARERLRPGSLVLLVVGDAGALRGPLGEIGHGPPEVWGADLSPRAPGGEPREAEAGS